MPVPDNPLPVKIIGSLTLMLVVLASVIKLPVALVALTVVAVVLGVHASWNICGSVPTVLYCASMFCTVLWYRYAVPQSVIEPL